MLPRYKSLIGSLLVACTAVALVGVAHAGPPPSCQLDAPTIQCVGSTPTSITLRICAGRTGAPGGISIQWKTCVDYKANGWSDVGDSYSAISLSGVCPTSNWDLLPGQCRDVTINALTIINENAKACGASGDAADLLCNTCYIFRAFAHNDPGPGGCNKSDFSESVTCTTAPCPVEGECTLSWGYWKTHGPEGCNPPGHENQWPVNSLNIGGQVLGEAALCALLQENPGACNKSGQSNGGSNAAIILEHQLIAAMLNAANGSISCAFADAAIAQANALLVGNVGACIGTSTPLGADMVEVAGILESYNNDQCVCPVQPSKAANAQAPTETQKSSWGKLKSIYR